MSKEKIKTAKTKEETTFQEGKVGTMLRDVRTKKDLTIDDVAEKLRIKSSYLMAIENSDYENIPGTPYGIGFVRSYASFLGLNSERISQIFKEETSPSSQAAAPNPPVKTEEIPDEENTATFNRKYIVMSIALLVLCYLLWLTITPNSNNEISSDNEISAAEQKSEDNYPLQVEDFTEESENVVDNNTIEETQQIVVTDAAFEETEENKAEPSENNVSEEKLPEETTTEPEETPAPKSEKVEKTENTDRADVSSSKKNGRVVLKIKKETWVEVKDENKLWISKVLQAGDEYILPENGVGKTVSFGNTDGVDVLIDGKAVTVISNNKKTNINMDAFLGNH